MDEDKKLPTDEELKKTPGQDDNGDDDLDNKPDPDKKPETVILTKEEHEKLLKERDDYRKRAIAKDDKEKKTPPKEDKKEGDFLTRSDFYKHNETVAIKMAEGETKVEADSFGMTDEQLSEIQADVKASFDEIKKFYSPKSGKDTSEDIFNDILDAHAAWRRRNPKKPADADKEARANLTKQKGFKGGSPDSKTAPKERLVTRPRVPPNEWYKPQT